ncbi:MAG TPA: PPK2 family polyphosphate kinase [Burkholderiaceae bacterium]|jgi:PPK2 family polyphosphate:nucleotide phosphotransferase
MADSFKHSHLRRQAPGPISLSSIDPAQRPFSVGDKEADKARLAELSGKLAELQDRLYAARRHKVLLVLQGMDTSGKDGTIHSVLREVNPLGVRAVSYKVPTAEEAQRDFLWRHHRDVPVAGEIVIFNRSHYEAVVVEYVSGLIDDNERVRRYGHIRAFEELLADSGTTLIKCFLHISKEEQQRRLQQRVDDPDRRWKIDESDLKARALWSNYQQAYELALGATATAHAPWYIVPSDSKSHRNLMVMEILLETLDGLGPKYPPGLPALIGLKIK